MIVFFRDSILYASECLVKTTVGALITFVLATRSLPEMAGDRAPVAVQRPGYKHMAVLYHIVLYILYILLYYMIILYIVWSYIVLYYCTPVLCCAVLYYIAYWISPGAAPRCRSRNEALESKIGQLNQEAEDQYYVILYCIALYSGFILYVCCTLYIV